MPIYTCNHKVCKGQHGRCADRIVTDAGMVIGTYEKNSYHDSDFMAIVWDPINGEIVTKEYATTRGWTYHNGAVADATEDVLTDALSWLRRKAYASLRSRALLEISEGTRVRSKTTRGKNKGKEGVVKRLRKSDYGYDNLRAWVEEDNGDRFWIDAHRLENIDTDRAEECAARALALETSDIVWAYRSYL